MLGLTRRGFVVGGIAAPSVVRAEGKDWPSGVISLVVPFAAGGAGDFIARLIQPGLHQRLATTVIVENRDGAASTIGAAYVAKGPRDGSRWLINADPQVLNPVLMPALPFDVEKDFDPVFLLGAYPTVFAAHPSKPFKTLADVIVAARQQRGGLGVGATGGSSGQACTVMLSKITGIELTTIPYRGGAPLLNDALAGHIDMIASNATLIPHIEAGKLHPIVQTGLTRHWTLPQVETVVENGFPNFEVVNWWGIFAPSMTPQPLIDRFTVNRRPILTPYRRPILTPLSDEFWR
ncbi:MAG: tripartite tricarboxylate transporter substrate-binding protein [Candidatus Sulfotelmatobacter sp.]